MISVLIVTSESDIHADVVINELNNSTKVSPIRLNSESFIRTSQYFYEWKSSGIQSRSFLLLEESFKKTKRVGVIWWRKPGDYAAPESVLDGWAIEYCQQETESLIYSLFGLYPQAKWINNYYNMRLPSHRINQIPVAQRLGIQIPPTLVTNSYEAIYEFLSQQGSCIIKTMRYSGFLHNDNQYGCYTRPIDLDTIEEFRESIRLAPVFLQKRIAKKAEYRVTLIGKHHFVCRIDAQHTEDPDVTLDWRVTEPEKLIHVPDELPSEYINKLYQMLHEFDLNFGAFDVIRDDDDTLYFIELNPNGQWYWIEILTGMPMVKAMVELIEELAEEYEQIL